MAFLRPDLWWVGLAAVLAILAVRRLGRRRVLSTTTFSLLRSHYRASRFRFLPVALVVLSLALVCVGLLEPVVPLAEQRVQQRALDIVLVVDLSLSMTQPIGFKYTPGVALPTAESGRMRMDAVKAALNKFITLDRKSVV